MTAVLWFAGGVVVGFFLFPAALYCWDVYREWRYPEELARFDRALRVAKHVDLDREIIALTSVPKAVPTTDRRVTQH